MATLSVENLTYVYGEKSPFQKTAIEDVTFSAKSGEIIGVIGHTGSGKSTLVQHFNGLLKANSGKVLLDGADIWENPKEIRKIRFKIGMVFQYPEYQLFEETVYKDIAFGPTNMGLSAEEINKRVLDTAQMLGITAGMLEKSPFDLSGGEKRRVAIAGVMAMQPEIIVFDEPTAGLDPAGRDIVLGKIKEYRDRTGALVFIVSHSMEDMARVADKLLVMNGGRLSMFDTVKKVFSNPKKLKEIGVREVHLLPFHQFGQNKYAQLGIAYEMETVKQLMPTVDALEDYFDGFRREHGLIELLTEKWNLVDWPMNLRDGYEFELSQPIGPGVHNVINAFYYGLKRDADRLRALVGAPLRNEAESVKRTYLDTFRMENGLFRDAVGSRHTALHSVVLPLYYGMIPEADVPAAIACIREKRMCCGVYMAYFVLKALARCGEYGLMNELTFSEEEHSWGNMLKEGATSCWEAWGKDQKWNTSLCHPWASAPIIIMIEDMAGIRAAKPGFEEISIEPHMPGWLGDVSLNFATVRGVVEAKRVSGEWTLNIK